MASSKGSIEVGRLEVYKGYALKHANCYQGGQNIYQTGKPSPQHYVGHWIIFENKPGGKRIDSALTREGARRVVDRIINIDERTIKPWKPGISRPEYGADLVKAYPDLAPARLDHLSESIADHLG